MYSEQLEQLIAIALADGELTDKTKQVLFRRAEKEGIDLDEFEMVLNSRISKQNQAQPTVQERSVSDKQGDIKKCPVCGAIAESFATKCADCGTEFRGLESLNSITKFFDDYQTIENRVVVNKNSGGLLGKLIGDTEQEGNWKRAVFTKKKEFIMHFPIPNSKEDILEFLSMAVPLATPAKKSTFSSFKKFSAHFGDDNSKNYDHMIAEVWMQKCQQIIIKARLSMKGDKDNLAQIEYYGQQLGIK